MATAIPDNGARVTGYWLAAATGGTLVRGGESEACGIVTDTRALRGGEVFVALAGDSFDGHSFLAEAVASGAVAVIVQRGRGQ